MNRIVTFPNILSASRIIIAPTTVFLILAGSKYHLLAFFLFAVASTTDFFDGYFARKYNEGTPLGAFLDPLADKILIISLFLAFYLQGIIPLWMVIAITIRDILVTGLRFTSIAQGSTIKTSESAKLKTALQFVAIYFLFLISSSKLGSTYKKGIEIIMYIVVLFTLWTGITYFFKNSKIIRRIFKI